MPAELPALADFCAALRETRVEKVALRSLLSWWSDPATFCRVVEAVSGHPSIKELDLMENSLRHVAVVEARRDVLSALEGVISAQPSALRSLTASCWDMRKEETAAFFDALAAAQRGGRGQQAGRAAVHREQGGRRRGRPGAHFARSAGVLGAAGDSL